MGARKRISAEERKEALKSIYFASGGHPRSRKGLLAKGKKTRAPKKQSSQYIIERKKK